MTDDYPLWESMKSAWLALPSVDPNKNDEKELEDEQ